MRFLVSAVRFAYECQLISNTRPGVELAQCTRRDAVLPPIRSAARDIKLLPTPGQATIAFMEFLFVALLRFAIFVSAAISLRRNR